MSRSALKDVLLDLKSQMRSARAKPYSQKKDEPKKKAKPEDEDQDDIVMEKKASKAEKIEPPDFSEEIRNFMKKQRVSKSDGATAVRFADPKGVLPKKKGKG